MEQITLSAPKYKELSSQPQLIHHATICGCCPGKSASTDSRKGGKNSVTKRRQLRVRVVQGPLKDIQKVCETPDTTTVVLSVSVQVSGTAATGAPDGWAKEQKEKNNNRQVIRIMAYNLYRQSYLAVIKRFYGKTA